MSKFVLTIDTDNSAFFDVDPDSASTDARNAEVARILRYAAEQVEYNTSGPLRDINGNTVGDYSFDSSPDGFEKVGWVSVSQARFVANDDLPAGRFEVYRKSS